MSDPKPNDGAANNSTDKTPLVEQPPQQQQEGKVDDGAAAAAAAAKAAAVDEKQKKRIREVPPSLHSLPEMLAKKPVEPTPAETSGDGAAKPSGVAEEVIVKIGEMSIPDALARFNVNEEIGLSKQEAEQRLQTYGPNSLPEVKENECLKFLSFMWNPLSWVMESAALVAIVLSNGPRPWLCNPNSSTFQTCVNTNDPPDYPDFVGIVCLLLLNSSIGYYEESVAGDAVSALMNQLTREYKVKRDGTWQTCPAPQLVPGDIIIIKLGDIIPADCKLLNGEDMKVDQAALTGESLPVSRRPGDEVYSGSTVKQGETEALVYATGVNTFLGKAANLVQNETGMGHLQTVLAQIGAFCMVYIGFWLIVLGGVLYGKWNWPYRRGIDQFLVALIGGVPIAMPTVLSVTMAIGVNDLAKEQAIVTRITAVEELAGMDVLCSDKTGTLTKNELTVRDPHVVEPFTASDIMVIAALASRRTGDPDPIDRCVCEALLPEALELLSKRYKLIKFIPFDPSTKRTIAHIEDLETNTRFLVSKGAPQVVINMVHNADAIREEQNDVVLDYARRGFRALGVCRSDSQVEDPAGKDVKWDYMGLLSLSDPPRDDTKATIQRAVELGIRVIMITGDQVAIGRETARELGMGVNFHKAGILKEKFVEGIPIHQVIEESQGWGEVMPEDKYMVVKQLRENGHIVGMTGDGVNDAPALKAADVGIAVSAATDAARAAADMVLLTEGLSVIIKAILGSRRIFQRMRNYAMYACCTTIRIVTTFGILSTAWQYSFPPFLCLIIAILNDGTIMTVSTDRVQPSEEPDQWRLREIFMIASLMGLYLTASSLVFFYLIQFTDVFPNLFKVTNIKYNITYPIDNVSGMMSSVMYLQVSITGQLIIFSTRAHLFFFMSRPSNFLMSAFVVAQIVATLIAVYADWPFTSIYGCGWNWAGICWIWSFIWSSCMDLPKLLMKAFIAGAKKEGGLYGSVQNFIGGFNGGSAHMSRRSSGPGGSRRASDTSRMYANSLTASQRARQQVS